MQQELFEVRDMRHKEKFQIDDAYLNGWAKLCGVYATGVYVSLCRHADKEQKCWPSLDKMAEELAISKTQVRRAIKILVEHNIIKVKRLGKKLNNRYYLVDKSEWSGRTLTISPQDTHICPDRTLHSKDTHIRYTQKKEGSSSKRYYRNQEMRFAQNKWWVIPADGGEWLEFDMRAFKETKTNL
jgi:biotin operon repressor